MASLLPNGKQSFVDDNGAPLVAGQVYFYIPNTSTLKNTFQDPELTILNTNPVILDARGEAVIWGSGSYRQVVYDQFGNLIWDQLTADPNAGINGNIVDATYTAGTDFTPGTTTDLTLPVGPGTISNLWVFFDGVYQGDDQIASLDITTLTFNSPIPLGVSEVYIKIGATVSLGIPADGSVTASKLAPNSVTASKLADASVFARNIQETPSGNFFAPNAQINRFNDRVFIGGATAADGKFPPVTEDWLSVYMNTVGYDGNYVINGVLAAMTLTATNAANTGGVVFAAQSLTAPSAGAATIATSSFAVNNSTNYATDAWCFYGEAHRTNSTVGSVYGMELDPATFVPASLPSPYGQGSTVGIQMASGAGLAATAFNGFLTGTTLTVSSIIYSNLGHVIGPGDIIAGVGVPTGCKVIATVVPGTYTVDLPAASPTPVEFMTASAQYDSSVGIQFVNNPTKFQVGITFGSTSLTGCDGVTGLGMAIAMAKGHQIGWYNPSAQLCATIVSTNTDTTARTGLNFSPSGLQVINTNGSPLAAFGALASATNYPQLNAGASGQPVGIQAFGTDANIDLFLVPKGAGVLRFGTYTSGAVSQTGYITITDASGTPRRLLVG